jgi:glycerol kinase
LLHCENCTAAGGTGLMNIDYLTGDSLLLLCGLTPECLPEAANSSAQCCITA